jgi:hypothetical protein
VKGFDATEVLRGDPAVGWARSERGPELRGGWFSNQTGP